MIRKTLRYTDENGSLESVELVSEDGISFSPASESSDSSESTEYGFATVDGRNFVLQTKNGNLQVLAETNTATKAERLARAANEAL